MFEHLQAILAGFLFCLPACIILLIWAWINHRGKNEKTKV
jgi:chromate transport protein ChrA